MNLPNVVQRPESPMRPFDPAETEAIAREHARTEGPLLPLLHAVQSRFGCIPYDAVPIIADVLNLTRAEVHGVVSFYHDFRTEPAGAKVVKLCMAEACQARGAREVSTKLEATLGVKLGETSADRSVTLEPVYCLGLCGIGPAALIGDRPYAELEGRGFARCLKAVHS
jgi:formate dehydrogenase subunit gamma